MTDRFDALSEQLKELGDRIQRKVREFDQEGASHADARRKAVDMQIEHARLEALAKAKHEGSHHPEQVSTLATDVAALKLSFEKWLAAVDKGY